MSYPPASRPWRVVAATAFVLWPSACSLGAAGASGQEPIKSVAYVDTSSVLLGLKDGSIRLVDLSQGRITSKSSAFASAAVSGVALATSSTAVLGSWDGRLAPLDLETGVLAPGLKLDEPIYCLASDQRGRVAAATRGRVLVFDVAALHAATAYAEHKGEVCAVALSPRGVVASCAEDCIIHLWEASSLRRIRVLTGHEDSVRGLAFLSDGSTLVSASWDGTVRVWDEGGTCRLTTRAHEGHVTAIMPGPGVNEVVSAGLDRRLVRWDCTTGAKLAAVELPRDVQHALSLAISPDRKVIAIGTARGAFLLADAETLTLREIK